VVSREIESGSRDSFMEHVFGSNFEDIQLPVTVVTQPNYNGVFNKIRTDPHAIGYDSVGLVRENDVKVLKVDGIAATPENVRNGVYQITRQFSVVYNKERVSTGAAAKFLEFMTSSNAQTIVAEKGLVGDPARSTAYVVEQGLSGTVNVSGGNTVKELVVFFAEEFMRLQPGVTVVVGGGGSGVGRNNVRDGLVDFGMVGTAVTSSHMSAMGGPEIIGVTKLCDDGIAVIVNRLNPITNITTEQLQRIYDRNAENRFNNWAELIAEYEAAKAA